MQKIGDGIRCILLHSKLPIAFWPLAGDFLCATLNFSNPWYEKIHGEAFYGTEAPFGCRCTVVPSKHDQVGTPKFEPRAKECIFLGYRLADGGKFSGDYLALSCEYFYNSSARFKFIITRDVKFYPTEFPIAKLRSWQQLQQFFFSNPIESDADLRHDILSFGSERLLEIAMDSDKLTVCEDQEADDEDEQDAEAFQRFLNDFNNKVVEGEADHPFELEPAPENATIVDAKRSPYGLNYKGKPIRKYDNTGRPFFIDSMVWFWLGPKRQKELITHLSRLTDKQRKLKP